MSFKIDLRKAIRKGALEGLKPMLADARRRFYAQHRRRTGQAGRVMFRRVRKQDSFLEAQIGIPKQGHGFYGHILIHGRRGYTVPKRNGKRLSVPIQIPARAPVPVFKQASQAKFRQLEETVRRHIVPVVDQALNFPPGRAV